MPFGLSCGVAVNGKRLNVIGLVFLSSVIHERFFSFCRQGIFEEILKTMLRFYHRQCRITGNGNRLTLNLFPLRWETQIQVKTLLTEPSWAAKFISS